MRYWLTSATFVMAGVLLPQAFADHDATIKFTPQETNFIQTALAGSRAEVEMAKMALKESNDSKIKAFAQRLLNDHMAVNLKLDEFARKGAIKEPQVPPVDPLLTTVHGQDFNKAYIDKMVSNHMAGVDKWEMAEKMATNPELKAFITSTVPTLRSHLKEAQSLQK